MIHQIKPNMSNDNWNTFHRVLVKVSCICDVS